MRKNQPSARQADHLMDEVYRQMLRVEAGCPAADLRLAVALLRAWMTLEHHSSRSRVRQWLRTVCPVCLRMIEAASAAGRGDNGKLSAGEIHHA